MLFGVGEHADMRYRCTRLWRACWTVGDHGSRRVYQERAQCYTGLTSWARIRLVTEGDSAQVGVSGCGHNTTYASGR